MTDLEIIGKMKDDIIKGNTADFLTLDVFDTDTNERHRFSEQFFDDMLGSLFKWSLSKTIVNYWHSVGNYRECMGNKLLSFNGSPCPVMGFTFVICESKDFQTNITPKLLKFLEVVLTKSGLSRLAFPAGRGNGVLGSNLRNI